MAKVNSCPENPSSIADKWVREACLIHVDASAEGVRAPWAWAVQSERASVSL